MAKEAVKKFIYVPKKGKVRVRFVGEQATMFQYFRTAQTPVDMAFGTLFAADQTAAIKRSFFKDHDDGNKDYGRSRRIVSLVVDREDDEIRAFACPISVWNQITDFAKENDFDIWREGVGLQTRYFVMPVGLSDLTDEQEKRIEATLESFTFTDIFVENDWKLVDEVVERIENRWDILDL